MSGYDELYDPFSRSSFHNLSPEDRRTRSDAVPPRQQAKAEQFFLDGMTQAMHNLADQAHPASPITIYYAFKQSETEQAKARPVLDGRLSLRRVMRSGLAIHRYLANANGASSRSRGIGTNALASSIILVCRPRAKDAGTISRRQFVRSSTRRCRWPSTP